jgi:hypothetical protein
MRASAVTGRYWRYLERQALPQTQASAVFDREVILDQTPQGYKDMDTRQALKVLVRP